MGANVEPVTNFIGQQRTTTTVWSRVLKKEGEDRPKKITTMHGQVKRRKKAQENMAIDNIRDDTKECNNDRRDGKKI